MQVFLEELQSSDERVGALDPIAIYPAIDRYLEHEANMRALENAVDLQLDRLEMKKQH